MVLIFVCMWCLVVRYKVRMVLGCWGEDFMVRGIFWVFGIVILVFVWILEVFVLGFGVWFEDMLGIVFYEYYYRWWFLYRCLGKKGLGVVYLGFLLFLFFIRFVVVIWLRWAVRLNYGRSVGLFLIGWSVFFFIMWVSFYKIVLDLGFLGFVI